MPQEIVKFLFAAVRKNPLLTSPSLMSVVPLACCYPGNILTYGQVRGVSSFVLNCMKDTLLLKTLNGHTTGFVFNA